MTGKINQRQGVSGKITPSGGTNDHNRLTNRDSADQHPIEAITNLQEILDSKLDSETALPLIEEAIKNKAKGLFFDVNKELAKKSYWYLTSEIDPVTKMGTKESVISGPYDLGAGGGGGGSGVTELNLAIATNPETGAPMWPYNLSVGNSCIVGVQWSSLRDDRPTGRGTMYCYVNEKLVETRNVAQGLITFELKEYIVSGSNKVEIKVVDIYNNTKNLIDSINGVTLRLTSGFEDDISYTGDIVFTYTPVGAIRKTVHFILDGREALTPDIVETTDEQKSKLIPASVLSTHGAHSLRVYFTVNLDGEEVKSNELYFDIIWAKPGDRTPIIASTYTNTEEEQYTSFVIRYRVYTPGKNRSTVYLETDGVRSDALSVDQKFQLWENRFDTKGEHTLRIIVDRVSKVFNITVKENQIHVEPVTDALELALTSFGRKNSDSPEIRSKWDYTNGSRTIEGKLTGFNWESNGWVLDSDNNTVLRLSGDARVTIEYAPFEADFTGTGKTFEFEIATSDVKNYEARIMECLDGADSITYSQGYAGEDTRQNKFRVSEIDNDKFFEKLQYHPGTYVFIYDGTDWNLDGTVVSQEELQSEYGITLEEIGNVPEEPSHYLAGDRVIIYYTVSGRGFYITPQLAKLQSQQSSLSTQYKEDDKVRLAFVVEKRTDGTEQFKTRLIYMYINGILSGVSRYPEGDSFKQTPAKFITIGSNDATLDIYNIRIYNNNLTRRQIVNNWIADTKDPVLKTKRYRFNDNYNDESKIVIDQDAKQVKGLTTTPYMILTGPELPAYKKDRKYMGVEYINPEDDNRNFTSVDARVDVQGTSSQYYYKKNFKIKFEQGFEDKNGNWSEHYKLRGEDSKKEKTFVYKADVASSEGTNNVELVRYFEDTKNWFSPAELEPDSDIPGSSDSKKRIRVGIDGFPIVMFWNDGNETKFYGKMNFNNDKGNDRTFGFKPGDECWEFVNNSTPQVLFKDNDLSEWASSFEGRYPEEAGDDEHPYGTLPEEREKLQSIVDWIVSTYRRPEDSEAVKSQKLDKFKNEFESHFDKNSSLFYYLYTELFLMVDSRAKNAMLAYLKSRQPRDGGNKWFWMPYDMDTALGINNEGLLVFNYDKEDTDHQEGANIFNGQESVFWNNLRDAFGPELKKMYAELRSASGSDKIAWSYANAEKYFEDHQAYWSESIFNEDAYSKYLEPYVLNKDATYLGMAQGSKLQQRRWWLYNRFKYLDSKYLAGDALKDTIMFRAYVPAGPKPDITVTPYQNLYVAALYRNGDTVVPIRAEKGKPVVLKNTVEDSATETDQETIIYSASQLMDIGDISVFRPGYADFSKAVKLQRLQIGSSNQAYENPNLKGLNIGANHLLTYLDARNCKNLGTGDGTEVTPTIDLSQCFSIEEAYFDNTQIKGCIFPVGGNLKKVHLPATLVSLALRNHPNLEEFVLEGTQNLTSLWLEDIPSAAIDFYNYVMEMPTDATVRLIGIDAKVNTESELLTLYRKLETLHGLTDKGEFIAMPQISGKIRIPTISYAEYTRLSDRDNPENIFHEIEIIPDNIICTVKFYDENNVEIESFRQNLTQGGNAAFPGILGTAPTDWADLTDWDCEDGFSYNEETSEFIDAAHDHYNNYYSLNTDFTFSPVLVDTTFTPVKYYRVPVKATTESKYYLFKGWSASLLNIQTDLNIYPVYEEFDRHFIVESDTHTLLIWAIPRKEDVIYGYYAHRSALSKLPPEVSLVRWSDTSTGETFAYETDEVGSRSINPITVNKHIVATWNDSGKPVFEDLSRVDYKTIHYKAVDNVGIVAYAITNTPDLPEDWIEVESTPVFEGTYEVTHAGNWYFWIKDSNENINTELAFLTCYSISKELAPGFNAVKLLENGIEIGEFALNATNVVLDYETDFHYYFEDADGVFINGTKCSLGSNIIIDSNKAITTTITPKSYTVNFNLCGRGNPALAPSQTVIYKHQIARPRDQYDRGFVIGGWYLNYESGYYYSDEWDFNSDVLDETVLPTPDITEITLYAEWIQATMPTIITIEVPEEAPLNIRTLKEGTSTSAETWYVLENKEVAVAYNQVVPYATSISWGDGSSELVPLYDELTGRVRITHQYAEAGTYRIEIQKRTEFSEYDILLGEKQSIRAVNPSLYVTDVNFAYDITRTNGHAFRETSITNLKLTPYMTAIADNAFTYCTKLTELTIPEGILTIGTSAFDECINLTKVNFPSTLTTTYSSCFARCYKLKDVSSLEHTNLRTIGSDFFDGCSELAEVILPETLVALGGESRGVVFRNCSKLKHVVLKSQNLITTGQGNFQGCPELKTAGPIGGSYNIEFAWTREIPKYAFGGYDNNRRTNVESITLPATIEKIGESAFWYSSLKSITFPTQSLTYIGDYAFEGDLFLTSVLIPSNITYLGYAAFKGCSLTDIKIYSVSIDKQKTVKDESPANKAWFWGNPSGVVIRIPRSVENDELAKLIYGYYWNFISTTEYLSYTNDI